MAEFVELDVVQHVGTLRLHRGRLNVLNAQMQREILEAAQALQARSDVSAVVIFGGRHAFAAGADIAEMSAMDAEEMAEHSLLLQAFTSAIAALPKPSIAAINGYALGGGLELALAADRRFASVTAQLGQPEIKLGIIPGAGGTQRLLRLIGPARARDLVYTGRTLNADEALSIGLVDEVHPLDATDELAFAWAAQFAGGPSLAMSAAKRAVDIGQDLSLPDALEHERQEFVRLFETHDRTVGMNAFLTKSRAEFRGT